jgi:hypothetical protein
VPHAIGLPGPPRGHRDDDRRFFCPKPRTRNAQVFQPKHHRTPVLIFRRGVPPGHVDRRDRCRLLQAGVPTGNRAQAAAGVAAAVTRETCRPGKWAAAARGRTGQDRRIGRVRVYNNGLNNRARFSHIFSAAERFIHATCDKRSLVAKYLSSCSLNRAVTSAS